MEKLYCPVKGSCLEEDCALYFRKESRCAILTACDLFIIYQDILLTQAKSCLQMLDLISVLNSRRDSMNRSS